MHAARTRVSHFVYMAKVENKYLPVYPSKYYKYIYIIITYVYSSNIQLKSN